ncbi:protein FAR1-RELATED SEQUENCE 5-like [Coffea arabica]|uniref:Protein FAR1-RELATED SEQUENCE 5-like n=1 Tax=Coffea arabica TaxID=13443 RepID=A0ABM4V9K9_COFAR
MELEINFGCNDDLNLCSNGSIEGPIQDSDCNDGSILCSNGPNLRNIPREPCEGMTFDNLDEAQACYKTYSAWKGFSIRKNHTRHSRKDKTLIGVDYVCSREGKRKTTKKDDDQTGVVHAITRVGYKAIMSLKLNEEEKWVVSRFFDQHNHDLTTPRSTRLLRGH